jgi:hypothetical protein
MKRTRPKDDVPASVDLLENSPFTGDLDAQLAPQPRRAKLPGLTLWLGAGVLAVVGFLGGVQADKTWGGSGGTGTAAGPAAASNRGAGGTGGFGGFGGGGQGGGGTTGTVTKVVGDVVYLKTADGKTVKVKTGDTTKITLSGTGKAKDLKSGASIVVRGETGSDGTVTATTVTEGGGTNGQPTSQNGN